jgi:hypothetical protein
MKLKFSICVVGALNENDSYCYRAGDVVTIDDFAEAKRFVAAGFAVPVVDEPEVTQVPSAETRGRKRS